MLNFQEKKQKQGADVLQSQVKLKKDDNIRSAIVEFQDYNAIGILSSFTRLLEAPTCDADNLNKF